MKKMFLALGLLGVSLSACSDNQEIVPNALRAPAYPLVSIDPYTSAWSMSNELYNEPVKHWTGANFPLLGAIKVDGEVYRFMGAETIPMDVIVPTSEQGGWEGKYVTEEPKGDWTKLKYNDRKWATAPGAFGTIGEEGTAVTDWRLPTREIWVRREVNIDKDLSGRKLWVEFTHDDDVKIYINETEVVNRKGTGRNVRTSISSDLLKQGENIIAAYCINTGGPGILDFGIVMEQQNSTALPQTAQQTSVDVQPMQTIYNFTAGAVDLKLTFTAPLFMDDLDLLSRPVNYISYDVKANDGQSHDVEVYFEASPAWALNLATQQSESEKYEDNELTFVKAGSVDQKVLAKRGDDIRIDWGYFYMAAEKEGTTTSIGKGLQLRKDFIEGKVSEGENKQRNPNNDMSITRKLGNVSEASGKVMIGYDDLYSIQFFKKNLRPYWNRYGNETIENQFHKANAEYAGLMKKAVKFGSKLMADAEKIGGRKYAELLALAYRQAIHAHKLVESEEAGLLWFSKENNSNGSIGTVDITYPSSPMFLYYNLDLAKGLMNHIFYYSESGKWKKPFPAHDVGTYPLANGQTYGGDMPVEEAGNMLITTAALTKLEGNTEYAKKHWDVMTVWADYLIEKGLDPENQLCTDDFAGHFAHNVNLSVKAIMGVASYGYMADKMGMKDVAEKYMAKAKEMGEEWMKMADDGDHYRLVFDKAGTWSQKYNMVWDDLMGYNIWPEEVKQKEIAYYLTKQNKYGLPLDNRRDYTKTDWIVWTATMAPDQATFEAFIDPIWSFYNETKTRVPMSDWTETKEPRHVGFKARSVVGGFWMKMLAAEKLK